MTAHAQLAPPAPSPALAAPAAGDGDALFDPPWHALDDAALLTHYRSDRGVHIDATVDPEEVPEARIQGLMQGRFEFNGETHVLPDPVDWLHNPSRDVEWHILLHKFYYAAGLAQAWQRSGDAAYVRRWQQLIDGWMQVTPPGFIAADVTGRRVQHWIYSLHGLVMTGPAAPVDAAFFRRLLHSIHQQVEYLCAHLTPKRNHRTLELLAIVLAGVAFPEFRRARHWRAFALAETAANLQADLLPDGVHCELSTDYHHLALRNWLQVRQLAARHGQPVPPAMDAALHRALQFSLQVHQPDGTVPSFSDGDARSYRPLLQLGADLYDDAGLRFGASAGQRGLAPARRLASFADSGYHVLRSGWPAGPQFDQAQHLVFDCGPLGEGNHGHFDALSFELAAFGRALVVDPGRYTYSEAGDTNWRVHFRGTSAHNTVCVDGRSQTRYSPKPIQAGSRHGAGAVRHKVSGPPPDTTLCEALEGPQLDLLHGRCASHEYDAVHERCIVFIDRRYWIVSDWLRADSDHDYALRFQLGAAAQGRCALSTGNDAVALLSPQLTLLQPRRAGQSARIDPAWVSARYGHKQAAPSLLTLSRGRDADFDTVLLPWADTAPPVGLATQTVRGPLGDGPSALRLQHRLAGTSVIDGWFHARGAGTGPWQIGGRVFTGRWLHWREAPDGRWLRAIAHAGAGLQGTADDAALQTLESA